MTKRKGDLLLVVGWRRGNGTARKVRDLSNTKDSIYKSGASCGRAVSRRSAPATSSAQQQKTHSKMEVNGKEPNGKHLLSSEKDAEVAKDANHGEEIDAVQSAMGSFGRWQLLVCLAISLVKFPVAWHQLGIVFMAPQPKFKCIAPNGTVDKYNCYVNVSDIQEPCTEWEYDRSIFPETIITQWDLVCGQSFYADTLQSLLMFGVLLGNIVFGSLSDRYGRKKPLVGSVVLQLVAGIGCAVVPWFPALLFLKPLSAFATGGTMVTSYVICMEIVGTKWRSPITVLYQIPYSLGHMTLAGLAYWFRHWEHLQIAMTAPSIILLGYWWVVPESPRWLLAMGRQKEACRILKKAAKLNKVKDTDIPDMVRRHCLHQNSKNTAPNYKPSFVDLLKTPNMRKKSIAIFFNWMICGMGLFGITQYLGQVGGDIFVNFAVSGATQIPGNIVSLWAMSALGRKTTLISSNTMTGIASLMLIGVPKEIAWLRLLLACCGIVGMSVSFTTVYLFSGELFPTVVRNIGVGTCSMSARIGSMVAPFVVSLGLKETRAWMPPTVFGILPLLGALFCYYLPETAGCTLPETLEDGENFGKKIEAPERLKAAEIEAAL
ncbi:organic cation transporter protein-like isoform X2 [Neodiprion virginianus]|uniref:organic cation transporter protein-like isoform X2 n=1 Tax=Neodiprion virginianus TaxID=2961670 RepID=UPI001EE748C6|nr:organic cation transporter protein-like isoform X2 [Neodiprion virginianus]